MASLARIRSVSLVVLALLVGGLTLTSYLSQRRLFAEIEQDRERSVREHRVVQWKMGVHLDRLEQEVLRLARLGELKEAFSRRDRGELLEQARPPLNRLRKSPLRVERINFYVSFGLVFLRAHDPEAYGDDVSDLRPLVAQAVASRRIIKGIEAEGKILFFWVATPLYAEGRFLGILEMGTPLASFLEEVKDHLGAEVGVFVKEGPAPGEFVAAEATDRGLLAGAAASLNLPRGVGTLLRQAVVVEDRNYAATLIPLEDLLRRKEGVLALMFDVTTVTRVLRRNTASFIGISATGFLLAAVLIFTLINRLQRVYQSLRVRALELEETSRHKSEFLANMSHELRTPLNAIIGFSQLLGEQRVGPLNEKQARQVAHILSSGRHLLALINDILDLSKVEAGKTELQPEPLDLPKALAAVLSDFRPQAEAKGLRLSLNGEACPLTLVADPLRIKQILSNLLSNAVKFTPEGEQVTVTARGVEDAFVEIAVTDTGIGIKAEDLPRLFQSFTQLDPVLSKRYQGTGLGLALTKRLVELHGGQISVESAGEGQGSSFCVRLPLSPRLQSGP